MQGQHIHAFGVAFPIPILSHDITPSGPAHSTSSPSLPLTLTHRTMLTYFRSYAVCSILSEPVLPCAIAHLLALAAVVLFGDTAFRFVEDACSCSAILCYSLTRLFLLVPCAQADASRALAHTLLRAR